MPKYSYNMKSKTCIGKTTKKPLSVYLTRKEAKEATEFVRSKYKKDMSPYKCESCNKWHLADNSRRTPSKTCSECLDGKGRSKEGYKTKKGATQRAGILLNEMRVKLQVYKCPHGNGWHLTKAQP